MTTAILAERIELLEGTINHEARTVDVVLIRPGWSQNGRYYSKKVLAAAAPLFEGVKAYANHPTREQLRRGEGRSVLDITGDYTGVHIGEGGELRATRTVYGQAGQAVWPLIERAIETRRPVIGISINALGKAKEGEAEGKKGIIVESVDRANSADDVDTPAAGGGFERLIADAGPSLIADLLQLASFEELFEARQDFVESVRKQMKRARQDDTIRALTEERDAAQVALKNTQTALAEAHAKLEAVRADQARLQERREVDAAFVQCNFSKPYEALLRKQLNDLPVDQWLPFLALEAEKAKVTQVTHQAVAVHGVPLREAAQVLRPAEPVGPIDPTGKTPAQLLREINARQQAKGN